MDKEQSFGICLYKIKNNRIKILLGTSSFTKNRWGLLKGKLNKNEKRKEAAVREFYEESSIKVNEKNFEKYFYQKNIHKDIGIWLYNYDYLSTEYKSKFKDGEDILNYSNEENELIKWFDIEELPTIFLNQSKLIKKITISLSRRFKNI